MINVLDYIKWRGDLSFEVAPINEVDLFLCTQIAMAGLRDVVSSTGDEISMADAAREYFEVHNPDMKKPGALQSKDLLPAFLEASRVKRYKNVMLSHHVDHVDCSNNEQFSAIVFRFSPKVIAVVYRGTDDTLIGWKEDCNLAVYDEVPAQRDALKYLEEVAKDCEGRIIVAGHSKGGNLAVFASSNADKAIRDRIIQVFNMDGPGFSKDFIENNEGYAEMKDRILTIVSQHSIIGTLMETPGRVIYVRSAVEGPRAHDGFNWEVDVQHFKRLKGLSVSSRAFKDAFVRVLDKLTMDEKEQFVNELFDILFDTGADTLTDFKNIGWKTSLGTVGRMTKNKAIREFFGVFMAAMMRSDDKSKKK